MCGIAHIPMAAYIRYIGACRSLMLRRLEDRIRDLCAKTITASTGDELESVLVRLKSALHEHTERIRKVAAAKLVSGGNGAAPERRSS